MSYISFKGCQNFVNAFSRSMNCPLLSYVTAVGSSNVKPASFKVKQIIEKTQSILVSLATHPLKPLEMRVKLMKEMKNSLQTLAVKIKKSIENRWWYCIASCFGYRAQCPKELQDIIDK